MLNYKAIYFCSIFDYILLCPFLHSLHLVFHSLLHKRTTDTLIKNFKENGAVSSHVNSSHTENIRKYSFLLSISENKRICYSFYFVKSSYISIIALKIVQENYALSAEQLKIYTFLDIVLWN